MRGFWHSTGATGIQGITVRDPTLASSAARMFDDLRDEALSRSRSLELIAETKTMSGSDGPRWRKSTFSGANGGGCVEVASRDGMILVRDTKDHGRGPVHQFTSGEWRAFIVGMRNGEFGRDEPSRLP